MSCKYGVSAGLLLLAAAIFFTPALAASSDRVTTCAIRWDAWYSNKPGVSANSTANTLSPSKWQFRAPVHARILSTQKLDWQGSSQAAFDNEIKISSLNNLTCWLYLVYGANDKVNLDASEMNAGLRFHLGSAIKSQVKYSLMVPSSLFGRTGDYTDANSEIVKLIVDSDYQTVLGGRPVLFIYYSAADLQSHWGGKLENFAEGISALRRAARSANLADPYVIVTTRDDKVRSKLGADALSAYNGPGASATKEPWSIYEIEVEKFWRSQANATTKDSIPTLMTGWDQRPRFERPPSFGNGENPEAGKNLYIKAPTSDELKNEFSAAMQFVRSSKASTNPAQLMVVYSWNENDEGGNALNPTIGDPTASSLHAISKLLIQ